MMARLLFSCGILLALHSKADLVLWKPSHQNAIYVLPENHSPRSYLNLVKSHPQLARFFSSMRYSNQDSVIKIKPDFKSSSSRALLLANSSQDHSLHHPRLDSFAIHFSSSLVVPVAAAIGLSETQELKYLEELATHFGLLLPLGGDDISPVLFHESPKPYGSRNTNLVRDQFEARIIRHFYYRSKRRIFAVCRGAQLTAAVLGAKIVQDNAKYLNIGEDHLDGVFHEILLRSTRSGNFRKILKPIGSLIVNSYHHQSIDASSLQGTNLEVAAVSPEGVVEAAESTDGRVILAQYHPEKEHPNNHYSSRFFQGLKVWAQMPTAISCNKVP